MSAPPHVVVSILNWNAAATTLTCVRSLLASGHAGIAVDIVVLDNGSTPTDRAALSAGLDAIGVRWVGLPHNIGFAAGHNVVLRQALADRADFVWLLNNDTLVPAQTLPLLLATMAGQPRCGAVSPVILALHDDKVMDFCGARHDWAALESQRPGQLDEARRLQAEHGDELWLHGTALLLRAAALRDTGLLEEDYFAYFEDDDIGVRLARAGWASRVCFEATIRHRRSVAMLAERPAYFFYLMARNAMLFWGRHAAAPHRRRLRQRLLFRALIEAARLRQLGLATKSDACLTGAFHGLIGRAGPVQLDRRPPLALRLASRSLPYRLARSWW